MNEPFLATTPFQIGDASQFFELSKDPNIKKEYPNMKFENIDYARHYLEHQIAKTESSRFSFFKAIRIIFNEKATIYTEKNNILIGFISLQKTGELDQMLAGGFEQSLSFAIKSAFRLKGLMTIALNMTLDAMKQDGYNVLPAIVKRNNPASIRVLEKCGFVMVRELPVSLLYIKRIKMAENEFNRVFGL
jgi:RimJ/RimL family protein N-acetyltransferase